MIYTFISNQRNHGRTWPWAHPEPQPAEEKVELSGCQIQGKGEIKRLPYCNSFRLGVYDKDEIAVSSLHHPVWYGHKYEFYLVSTNISVSHCGFPAGAVLYHRPWWQQPSASLLALLWRHAPGSPANPWEHTAWKSHGKDHFWKHL